MKCALFILILVFLASCNKSGSKAFESLEETPDSPDIVNDPSSDGPIVIDSVTPADSPYILTGGLDTFAIQIAAGAGGSVTYDFRLDGVSVQDSTAAFYVYDSAGAIAGAHTLEVIASNPTYSESHTFNLYRNSAPVLNLVNNTATTISCIGGTFTMNLAATDVNGDPLTFTFYHNGSTGSSFLANGSGASTATTTFTPNCSVAGNNNIKVRVTDAYGEYDEETVAVTVTNPSVASITSYSPLTNPVIITPSSSQIFQISPDGTSPFGITWTLDNGVGQLASCDNDSTCEVDSNGGARVGAYVLNVELSDQGATTDDMDFNIYFNAAPVLAGSSPSNAAPIRFSCDSVKTFQVNITDQNGIGAPQSHSITWYYNDVPVTSPTLSSLFSVSTNVATHPFISTLTFTPSCSSLVLGDGVIKAVYSDDIEEGDNSWDIHTSFLSTECLNLDEGEICTIAGIPGMSDDVEVGTTLVSAATINGTNYSIGDSNPNYSKVRIRPNHMEEYVSGGDKGLFITDTYHHTVWFYNHNSSGNITVNGVTVGPKKIKILVGNGAPGFGISGETGKNFYLNRPMGVAFHNSTGNLYVADYGNNRVLKISNTGAITSYTTPGAASNSNGDDASLQKCQAPVDLEISNGRLYVSCYGNNVALDGAIKYFDLSNDQGTNVVMYAATNAAGAVGVAAAARPWSLAKHTDEETIFFAVYTTANCNIGVINNTVATNNTYSVASTPTSITVNSGTVDYFMFPGKNCNTTMTVGNINTDAVRLREYGDIEVKMNGATLEGLFVSQQAVNYVSFMNLSSSDVKVGNRTVSIGQIDRILGTGTAGRNYVSAGYSATLLNSPKGLSVIGSDLYVADVYSFSVAKLDFGASNGNGAVSAVLGTIAPYGYDGEVDGVATSLRLAGPGGLSYDSSRNRLYFSEMINPRIRYIDLDIGRIRSSFGSSTIPTNLMNAGADTTSTDPLLASVSTARLVQDLSIAKDIQSVLFTDVRTDSGALSVATNTGTANTFGQVQHTSATAAPHMCHLRAFNDGDTDRTIFGKSVQANYVTNLAGDQTSGCHAWNQTNAVWTSTIEGQASTSMAFGSGAFGVLTNDTGTVSYISMRNNHCIAQVGATITTFIGKCNSGSGANSGSTNGALLTARLNSPGDLEWEKHASYLGNFFIADRTLTTGSLLRYVNFTGSSVDADGDGINDALAGSVGLLTHSSIPALNYLYGVAANEEMLCFSQGAFAPASTSTTYYNHNVICIDRISGRGKNKTIGIQTLITTVTLRNRMATASEEEGDTANSSISMHAPMGLAFDGDGNLYIAENGSNTIKMVKRWY